MEAGTVLNNHPRCLNWFLVVILLFSGSIRDTDTTFHVGRPPKQDIEHVPLEKHSTQARWRLEQCSAITQGV
jgi:hypothetical protein